MGTSRGWQQENGSMYGPGLHDATMSWNAGGFAECGVSRGRQVQTCRAQGRLCS